jgi:hypothetical protein
MGFERHGVRTDGNHGAVSYRLAIDPPHLELDVIVGIVVDDDGQARHSVRGLVSSATPDMVVSVGVVTLIVVPAIGERPALAPARAK